MRKIVEVPVERLQALPKHFSAYTAVPVKGLSWPGEEEIGVWRCELNMADGVWAAVYAGPTSNECWSYVAWRTIEVCGRTYREAVGQCTEANHIGKGLATLVLEAALQDATPLLSDREGMTYPAFRLWHRRALKGGAVILDTETGDVTEVTTLKRDELWHDGDGCERQQLVFLGQAQSNAGRSM